MNAFKNHRARQDFTDDYRKIVNKCEKIQVGTNV